MSEWDLANYSSLLACGMKKEQSSLLVLFMSNYFVRTRWAIPQKSVKYDSRHPLTDALTFLCYFFLLQENVSATGYQRPQTYIMRLNWASTAIKPHLQYQHSILQIIHSLLWILQTIRTLPRARGNGSIWAFQTHSQGAVLVPSVASLTSPPFIRQLASQYLHLRSESTNKESAFTSRDRP